VILTFRSILFGDFDGTGLGSVGTSPDLRSSGPLSHFETQRRAWIETIQLHSEAVRAFEQDQDEQSN
jgi:hypothetical protein